MQTATVLNSLNKCIFSNKKSILNAHSTATNFSQDEMKIMPTIEKKRLQLRSCFLFPLNDEQEGLSTNENIY